MADADNILDQILAHVANKQEFYNYGSKVTLHQSEGANYTSKLYTVTLSSPGKNDLHLFVKVSAISEKFRKVVTSQVFETEINFYTKVVPKYRELEERYNFPAEIRLDLPKYYDGSTELNKETLVLEDLSVKNYQSFDRFKCFDWEYASQCVSALARLHALSVAFLREGPEVFAEKPQESRKFPSDGMKDLMNKAIANALVVTKEEHRENLAKFFEKNMTDEGLTAYFNPKHKVTLNYGDFRPSNVLHKRDENGNLKVAFVDFQLVKKSNPLMDLVFFLVCGSDEKFRGQYKQQYFEHYYKEFSATLERLAIDPDEVYSKQDFDADVETFLSFGLLIGVILLPIITVDVPNNTKPEEPSNFKSLTTPTNHRFKTRFNGLVNDYAKWGYFN